MPHTIVTGLVKRGSRVATSVRSIALDGTQQRDEIPRDARIGADGLHPRRGQRIVAGVQQQPEAQR